MVIVSGYTQFGGSHAETASLTNVLAAQGVRAPHNDQHYSEAMLFGIGGGLGAGYILWEFQAHHVKVLVFGWQNQWQYPIRYYEKLCGRIGVTPTFHEAGSPKPAAKKLEALLEAGKPVVAWVDRAHMPYLQLPEALKGHIGHIVSIFGLEGETVWVDDLAAKPFTMTSEEMAPARGRITSYKNRLLELTPVTTPNLPIAIMSGIQDEIEHLSQPSDSFSLPTFRKWGRMMTDRKNAKGWHVAFADRRGLYGALTSVYDGIELIDVGGGGLRGLYANFLDEAAEIVQRPALREVAAAYRNLAAQWTQLAETALPDAAPFGETKRLLRDRHNLMMSKGAEAFAEMLPLTEQIARLQSEYNRNFPLSDSEIDALFSAMGEQLLGLYNTETATLAQLREASTE